MKKAIALTTCATLISATPALADPTLGFGLNFTFGNGGVNTGLGVRVFSNDEQDKAAASIGLDYLFGSESWRGSLGAAYLMDNSYVELNGGYIFGPGVFDFGLGVGGADTAAGGGSDVPGSGGGQ